MPIAELVNGILAAAGLEPVRKTISPRMAFLAGWVLETVHRLLRLRHEPRMTRFLARQLATAHWYDISAARRDLGYEPVVTIEEGLSRLKAWFASRDAQVDSGPALVGGVPPGA